MCPPTSLSLTKDFVPCVESSLILPPEYCGLCLQVDLLCKVFVKEPKNGCGLDLSLEKDVELFFAASNQQGFVINVVL